MNFKMTNFFPLFLLTLLSCGGDGGSGSDSRRENQTAEGEYRIIFQKINSHVQGNNTSGTGTMTLLENEMSIRLTIIGAPSNSQHIQTVHAPGSCPSLANDANADSYVDALEMNLSEALVKLDADLNSGSENDSNFPAGSSYSYQKIGPMNKLGAINLEGSVVIIHGASASPALPETVAALDKQSNEASLPIACGIIVRVPEE